MRVLFQSLEMLSHLGRRCRAGGTDLLDGDGGHQVAQEGCFTGRCAAAQSRHDASHDAIASADDIYLAADGYGWHLLAARLGEQQDALIADGYEHRPIVASEELGTALPDQVSIDCP